MKVFQTITCICTHENTHPYKLGAIGINRVEPAPMGPATETTTVTDMLSKATEGNGLESSYEMVLEVEKYQSIEMETVWRNTVCLLPLLLQRGIFGHAQKGSMCLPQSRASCSLRWGGQLGCERHRLQSWELSLECWQPKYFLHQGTVKYLFSSFLSPTHSFQMRPIGSQWYWEGRTTLQSQSAIVRWKNWVLPSSAQKKLREEVRAAAQSLPVGHEGAARWWNMPGIPPPWCRMGPSDRSQGKLLNVVKHRRKKVILKS